MRVKGKYKDGELVGYQVEDVNPFKDEFSLLDEMDLLEKSVEFNELLHEWARANLIPHNVFGEPLIIFKNKE